MEFNTVNLGTCYKRVSKNSADCSFMYVKELQFGVISDKTCSNV